MRTSKTLKYIIGGIFLVALIAFIVFESACRERMDKGKRSAFSDDKETAIKEGFYIGTYFPIQSSLIIPSSKDTINLDSAWSEHSWTTERRLGFCLCEHKIKGESYNFCMPFSTTSSDINSFPFDIKQLENVSEPYYDPGSFFGNRFNFGLNALDDTIKIIITQKQIDTITSNHFVDTILFIRTKNSR